ncbi:MAG: GDP-mannose 4,6-dehydratase [Candidatus Micrarchaeota archaeon]
MGFWSDKRVLITGGNGFIGSWLTEKAIGMGAKATLLIRKESPVGLASIPDAAKKATVVRGDLRDAALMERICQEQDVILHLAAVTQVLYSIRNPQETVEVDVNGTLNILEAMRKKNDGAFLVFTSTDKVYGEPAYLPIDENHPISAKSPYDASKLAADRLAYSYHVTYGIRESTSRCSNVIGGRDANILRAIPSFVYFLMQGRRPVIRTAGRHLRDYLYVDDAVRAIMLLAEKQEKSRGKAFNFGTGKPTSVMELGNMVAAEFGPGLEPLVQGKIVPGEIDRQYLSSKLAEQELGWKSAVPLEEGVRRAVEWYRKNPQWLEIIRRSSSHYGYDIEAIYG